MSLNSEVRRRTLLFVSLAVVAGAATISACSSDTNPPDAGTLALALAPTAINVAQGGSGSSAASITRGGAFTGPVTLTASGAPTGVTVTFSPGLIPTGSTSAGINVAVDAAVTAGAKTITINAAGTGVTTATATLTVTVTTAAAGSVVLVPNPTTLSATAGGAAVTSAIGITRTAPFAGAVDLTVSGAPANVTATLTPTNVPGNSSTLSVTAAAGAVNGTYPLVVRATGTGIADATASIPVTVTGGATAGASFTFGTTPLPVTAGGASNTSTVTIARTGTFAPNGALNLALTGAPAGLTASIAPSSNVTGATATVTAQASGAVAAGTYNLTLTGTGTGIPNATGTLPVVVSAPSGGGNFSVAFCTADAPVWVAQQDNNGAWTRVLASAGSTYQFSFPSGKGGVAFVDTVGTGTDLTVVYGTVAEFSGLGGSANFNGCGTKNVTGTVANVGAAELATVSLGFSSASTFQGLPAFPAFTIQNVPDGSLDLVATRTDATTFAANKVILRRGLNVTSLPVLDFNAAEAFAPVTANVTVTGLGTDEASIISSYGGVYGSRTIGNLSFLDSYTSASGAVPYTAIPVAQLTNPLELSRLYAFSDDAVNSDFERTAGVYFRTPAAKTIAIGPKLNTPTVTKNVTGAYAWPRVVLTSQTQYNRLFSANYDQTTRSANVFATAGYYGAAPTTWDVTLPDLSGVTGWTATWGLAGGSSIEWAVSVDGGAVQFLDANTIVDGSTFQSASVFSQTLALRAARSGPDPLARQRRLLEIFLEQSQGHSR